MENEIRYYLKQTLDLMNYTIKKGEVLADGSEVLEDAPAFEPKYLVTAVKLPTGAIEIAVNNENIADKINYILDAYDDNMHLKSNPDVSMSNIMIV